MPKIRARKAFRLLLNPAEDPIPFAAGDHEVDQATSEHFYVREHAVLLNDDGEEIAWPEAEKPDADAQPESQPEVEPEAATVPAQEGSAEDPQKGAEAQAEAPEAEPAAEA